MSQWWNALVEPDTLWNAWEEVRRKGSGGPGVDGQSIAQFEWCAPSHLSTLRRNLQGSRYQPQPLRGVYIPKAAGGWRSVGIPTVRDRVAQRACLDVLLPLLDAHLEECSYAYLPGRSIKDAVTQLEGWRDDGHAHLLESDIQSCFESIDRELLLATLSRYVPDARLVELVGRWLEAGTVWHHRATASALPEKNAGDELPPDKDVFAARDTLPLVSPRGIPQGSVLSPLLCNLFLDALDEALLHRRFKLVRYADDFVIVSARHARAEAALHASHTLLAELGLRLHPAKTRLTTFEEGFRYLGTVFLGDLTLPTVRREVPGANGPAGAVFVPGYPEVPRLPLHTCLSGQDRPSVPQPPPARSLTAVSSVAHLTRAWNPDAPLLGAFEAALHAHKHQSHCALRQEPQVSWETNYLV